jgi:DNA polymerase-3 subunit gamma/tau
MGFILQQEKIEFEAPALKLLSRAADGSMRDGLSLLDQAIVYGNGKVPTEEVRSMLGTVAQQPVDDLLIALAQNDAPAILDKINEIANLTPDFSDVLHQMLQILHRVALVQQVPSAIDHDFDIDMIATLASQLQPADVQLFYQIGLVGQKDLNLAPDPRSGFEMVMLRMLTFKPATMEPSLAKPFKIQQTVSETPPIKAHAVIEPASQNQPPANPVTNDWLSMIVAMRLTGPTKEFANNCVLEHINDTVCNLIVDPDHIRGSGTQERLQKALQAYRGKPVKLVINAKKTTIDTPAVQLSKDREDKQQASVEAINSDHNILALKEHFDARILPGTIEPV